MVVIMGGDARRPVFEADATMGRVKRPAVPLLEGELPEQRQNFRATPPEGVQRRSSIVSQILALVAQRSASNGTGTSPPIPHSAKFTGGAPTTRTSGSSMTSIV